MPPDWRVRLRDSCKGGHPHPQQHAGSRSRRETALWYNFTHDPTTWLPLLFETTRMFSKPLLTTRTSNFSPILPSPRNLQCTRLWLRSSTGERASAHSCSPSISRGSRHWMVVSQPQDSKAPPFPHSRRQQSILFPGFCATFMSHKPLLMRPSHQMCPSFERFCWNFQSRQGDRELATTGGKRVSKIALICKELLINFYKGCGFELVGLSPVVHGDSHPVSLKNQGRKKTRAAVGNQPRLPTLDLGSPPRGLSTQDLDLASGAWGSPTRGLSTRPCPHPFDLRTVDALSSTPCSESNGMMHMCWIVLTSALLQARIHGTK